MTARQILTESINRLDVSVVFGVSGARFRNDRWKPKLDWPSRRPG